MRRGRRTAFIGARFTSALGPGGFDPELRRLIESAHEVTRSNGLFVRSAHEEERFGEALAKPIEIVPRDLEQIAESDIFIGLWDTMLSPGLLIELGWASSLGKEIILIMPNDYNISSNPMIQGLGESTALHIIQYDGTVPSFEEALRKALERI